MIKIYVRGRTITLTEPIKDDEEEFVAEETFVSKKDIESAIELVMEALYVNDVKCRIERVAKDDKNLC